MIAYTIPQAAARVFRDETEVKAWITAGHLIAVRNPIDGQVYVEETHLRGKEHGRALFGQVTQQRIRIRARCWTRSIAASAVSPESIASLMRRAQPSS